MYLHRFQDTNYRFYCKRKLISYLDTSMSKKILRISKYLLAQKYFPIFVLLCINLFVGALVITDYGESWDEHLRYRYAENSLNAYRGIPGGVKDEKGPFFVMVATLGGNLIHSLRENCLISAICFRKAKP